MNHKIITIKNAPTQERKGYNANLAMLLKIPVTTLINKIFMNIEFEGKKELQQELRRKWTSYQSQDKKKKKYNATSFITYEELLELLVSSRMRCHYCRHLVQLIYKCQREPYQWTLDRIDNSLGHNTKNVVMSCLQCNLQRRTQNKKKFLYSKQMRIIKQQ
jgi:predicted nucleotide-binding protein (sugar kinase/HSP70/actin superfamily)